jgi:predicted SAM-dependent methyltransferase
MLMFDYANEKLVLDVGCGKHKRGTIGIDYSKDSEADLIADAHFLPFKDGVFDKVVSTTVLEHSPNPLVFLKEQHRVLKENGEVELVTDNAQYYKWSVLKFRGKRHEDYHKDHYMIFFPKNLQRLFKLAGFKVTSIKLIGIKGRLDPIIKVLAGLGLVRKESLYYRIKVTGEK